MITVIEDGKGFIAEYSSGGRLLSTYRLTMELVASKFHERATGSDRRTFHYGVSGIRELGRTTEEFDGWPERIDMEAFEKRIG